jgi:hypothetical protein
VSRVTPSENEAAPATVAEYLAACTEAGRLQRARKITNEVEFVVADDALVIAAVAKYNVVIDIGTHRIQHGCRDFQTQARTRHLCKHVAATVLALEEEQGLTIAAELAEGAGAPRTGVVVPWSFEVITRFTPS